MITLIDQPVWLFDGTELVKADSVSEKEIKKYGVPGEDRLSDEEGRKETITYGILKSHSTGKDGDFHITFDSLISHDLTYVGIIQTARASGLKEFPLPYVLTSCHNSLCAVGWYHQQGRPLVRNDGLSEIWRNLCSGKPVHHSLLCQGDAERVRTHGAGIRQPYQVWSPGYHGNRRRRRRTGKAASQ